MSGWQTIATASKDSDTRVDLWSSTGQRYTECWWSGARWVSFLAGDCAADFDPPLYVILEPTHWMLPPSPPEPSP